MAVGVGLHHRHQLLPRRQGLLEDGGIVGQGLQIHLPPGPGGGGEPPGRQGQRGGGQREGEDQHGAEVAQAVRHQQRLRPQPLRSEAHQHDAPGVDDIDQSGETPGGAVLPLICPQQGGEQEGHHQRQKEVHTVVPLDPQAVEPQRLAAHGGQGGQQPYARAPPGEPPSRRPQQQEQGHVEQPVPGVGEHLEERVIRRFQPGDPGDQPIVAVAAQAHEVQYPRRRQGDPQPQPPEPPGDGDAQQQSREVPQVVEGAVCHQPPEKVPVQLPGVEVQRQIQQNAGTVQHRRLFPEGPDGAPALLIQEVPADHQEEGHRRPGQHPGEIKVPQGRVGGQWRGVDGRHQHRRRQAEPVQGRAPHAGRPQAVTMNPPALSPETWQQPSGSWISVSSPAQGT